jgi:hypothetical protein
MSSEHGIPSTPRATHCYAIVCDGVYAGVEHFRYRLSPSGSELVNFEFTLPNGHQWRDGLPANDIFKDCESAQCEWDRRFA